MAAGSFDYRGIMMDRFIVNGYLWKVHTVNPSSHYLVDRTGVLTVATTDPATLCVYLSADLLGISASDGVFRPGDRSMGKGLSKESGEIISGNRRLPGRP